MNPLLVLATEMERDAVFPQGVPEGWSCCVTGVGILETTFQLSQYFAHHSVDFVLQMGIAGAYPASGFSVGDLVRVDSEVLVELGVEESDGAFTPWNHQPWGGERRFFSSPVLASIPQCQRALASLPSGVGATVQMVTGTLATAQRRAVDAQVESMEGAACLAVAQWMGIPCFQVRAISNMAQMRDRKAWDIPWALQSLHQWALQWMAPV